MADGSACKHAAALQVNARAVCRGVGRVTAADFTAGHDQARAGIHVHRATVGRAVAADRAAAHGEGHALVGQAHTAAPAGRYGGISDAAVFVPGDRPRHVVGDRAAGHIQRRVTQINTAAAFLVPGLIAGNRGVITEGQLIVTQNCIDAAAVSLGNVVRYAGASADVQRRAVLYVNAAAVAGGNISTIDSGSVALDGRRAQQVDCGGIAIRADTAAVDRRAALYGAVGYVQRTLGQVDCAAVAGRIQLVDCHAAE